MISVMVLVLLGILILGAFVLYKRTEEGEREDAEMTVKHLYYYLVLFATLMMSIGGSVGVFMSAADYISPRPYYESFEQYKLTQTEKGSSEAVKSEADLQKAYDTMVETERERARDGALNGMIKSLGWIIIPLPVFLYFQRQIRRK